jgi:hypothetical protein
MGYFSSDRTILEYAKEIWDTKPVSFAPVPEGNRGEVKPVSRAKKPTSASETISG